MNDTIIEMIPCRIVLIRYVSLNHKEQLILWDVYYF